MAPGLTDVTVKVTVEPEQIVVADAVIFTNAGVDGNTVMVMGVDAADWGFAQLNDDVITTETLSPLFIAELSYEGLLYPTLLPFTFH